MGASTSLSSFLLVSLLILASSSALKSVPPMGSTTCPAPWLAFSGTTLPPLVSSYTRGSGAESTALVDSRMPASRGEAGRRHATTGCVGGGAELCWAGLWCSANHGDDTVQAGAAATNRQGTARCRLAPPPSHTSSAALLLTFGGILQPPDVLLNLLEVACKLASLLQHHLISAGRQGSSKEHGAAA